MDDGRPLKWVVAIDCHITRRKWYHLIVAPDGQVVFRSKLFGGVLDWLDANDVDSFEIVSDSPRRQARISRVVATGEK